MSALETWQAAVLDELQRIRQAIEGQQRPAVPLSPRDRARLARMLPALAGVYGADEFSSRDLVEDDRPAVRLVMQGMSVKQTGKLFSRAAAIPIDGLMVQKQGVDFQVTKWLVVAC